MSAFKSLLGSHYDSVRKVHASTNDEIYLHLGQWDLKGAFDQFNEVPIFSNSVQFGLELPTIDMHRTQSRSRAGM